MVVEGLTTAPVLRDLSHRLDVEMPITEGVCTVLDGVPLGDLVAGADAARPDLGVRHRRGGDAGSEASFGQMSARSFSFSSESVTEGHPDKIADQISDAVLDAVLDGRPRRPRRVRDADHDGARRRRRRDHDDDLRRHPAARAQDGGRDRLHPREVRLRRRDLRRHRRARRAVARHRAGRRRVVRGAARRRRPDRPDRRRRPGDDVRLRVERDRGADAAADPARAPHHAPARGGAQGRRAAVPAAGRQGAGDRALRGRRARPPAPGRDRARADLDAASRRPRRRDADQARPDRARAAADPAARPLRREPLRATATSSTSTRPASS